MRQRVTREETLAEMPRRLSSQTRGAVVRVWKSIQTGVQLSVSDMPPFAAAMSESIWALQADDVLTAMQRGDVPFFVAMLLRLDLLNDGLTRAGRPVAERASILNAKWVVEGFRLTAERNLRKLGGHWPPSNDWGEDESVISGAPAGSADRAPRT